MDQGAHILRDGMADVEEAGPTLQGGNNAWVAGALWQRGLNEAEAADARPRADLKELVSLLCGANGSLS